MQNHQMHYDTITVPQKIYEPTHRFAGKLRNFERFRERVVKPHEICRTQKSSEEIYRNYFSLTEPKIDRHESAEPLKFTKTPIFFSVQVIDTQIRSKDRNPDRRNSLFKTHPHPLLAITVNTILSLTFPFSHILLYILIYTFFPFRFFSLHFVRSVHILSPSDLKSIFLSYHFFLITSI